MKATDPNLAALPDADRQQVEAWLIDFDLVWHDQLLKDKVRELPFPGSRLRQAVLAEMVKIDLERQWRSGRTRTLESYLSAYPELGTPETVSAHLIHAEYQARQLGGCPAELVALERRFPRQAEALQRLVRQASAGRCPEEPTRSQHATPGPVQAWPETPTPVANPAILSGQFGRYFILRPIGEGGMGAVYLAQDTQLGRQVALKIPHVSIGTSPVLRERFLREAQVTATLKHPNICQVYDAGEIDGRLYLTMEYVEGKPLAKFAGKGKAHPQRQAATLIRLLASTLHEAHRQGIIHRDVKPANVMLHPRRGPVVMDFGLARRDEDVRITRSGVVLGTPAYMSPEQMDGEGNLGPASDQYSLGVMLYELLTGRLPFDGPMMAVLAQKATQDPEPPSVRLPHLDRRLEEICLRMMARKPADRYASLADVADVLGNYLRSSRPSEGRAARAAGSRSGTTTRSSSEDVLALPTTGDPPAQQVPPRRRARWTWSVLMAAVVGLLGCAIVFDAFLSEGTIRIEISDPAEVVEVRVDGAAVDLNELSEPLRLRTGRHKLRVTGERIEPVTESFTVKRGPNPDLRIEVKRLPDEAPSPQALVEATSPGPPEPSPGPSEMGPPGALIPPPRVGEPAAPMPRPDLTPPAATPSPSPPGTMPSPTPPASMPSPGSPPSGRPTPPAPGHPPDNRFVLRIITLTGKADWAGTPKDKELPYVSVVLNDDSSHSRGGRVAFRVGARQEFFLQYDYPVDQVRGVRLNFAGKNAWRCRAIQFELIRGGRVILWRYFDVNATFSTEKKDQGISTRYFPLR
jgi:predicted Ser/Thr protein kinase